MNAFDGAAKVEGEDILLYEHEARLFSRKIVAGEKIGARFRQFAGEEASHLEALRTISPNVSEALHASLKAPPDRSLRQVLRVHEERELIAIAIYEALLRKPLPALQALALKGILSDERRHLETIRHYLLTLV